MVGRAPPLLLHGESVNSPAMRLPIEPDCCAGARRAIAAGLDGGTLLEFCRGDMICLRGRASAFAALTVQENAKIGPRFIPWRPYPSPAEPHLPVCGSDQEAILTG